MAEKFTITPVPGTVVVRAGGAVLAETSKALLLREEGRDPVHYFPRADVGMEFLDRSETRTTCPHKGEATHWNIVTKSTTLHDAAWSYDEPLDGAAEIAGHLAFYPDKAVVEEL